MLKQLNLNVKEMGEMYLLITPVAVYAGAGDLGRSLFVMEPMPSTTKLPATMLDPFF